MVVSRVFGVGVVEEGVGFTRLQTRRRPSKGGRLEESATAESRHATSFFHFNRMIN